MTFFALGLNHLRAPVRVRERFALDAGTLRHVLRSIPLSEGGELIVLSTCNRTEAYVYGTEADVATVKDAVAACAGVPWPEEAAFELRDEAAVRHVLHVACGLNSLVLGDAQIFAQVKDAYRVAVEEDRVGTGMHRLMHTAFRAAKRVINETALTTGAASVPRVAISAIRSHLAGGPSGDLEGARILIVGAGEMGRQTVEALRDTERTGVLITNRSPERAAALAELFSLECVPWEARHDALCRVDAVVVATGADEPVLLADEVPPGTERVRPRLLVDISVPRNVDRRVDGLPGYRVLDLDQLNTWLVETERVRRAAVPAAEAICDEMLAEFVTWVFHHQALQPTIQAIRETFEQIRLQEIERHHHRVSDLDRAELDRLTRSIVQKVLAVPIVRLKNVDPDSIDFVHGIRLLHALFSRPGCEDDVASVDVQNILSRTDLLSGEAACGHCPVAHGPAAMPAAEASTSVQRPHAG